MQTNSVSDNIIGSITKAFLGQTNKQIWLGGSQSEDLGFEPDLTDKAQDIKLPRFDSKSLQVFFSLCFAGSNSRSGSFPTASWKCEIIAPTLMQNRWTSSTQSADSCCRVASDKSTHRRLPVTTLLTPHAQQEKSPLPWQNKAETKNRLLNEFPTFQLRPLDFFVDSSSSIWKRSAYSKTFVTNGFIIDSLAWPEGGCAPVPD